MTKQKIPLAILAAAAVILIALILQPDPSISADSFQLPRTLESSGYSVLMGDSRSPREVSLPLWIEWHPRHWHMPSGIHAELGSPNSVMHYTVVHNGSSKLDCFVRYLDGRACFVEIRCSTEGQTAAVSLQQTLAREFKGLPIRLVKVHD